MEYFDLFKIIKTIQENNANWNVDSRCWDDRISSININWLPDFAQEAYTSILNKVYSTIGNGNPIRDLIFHIAAQKLIYRSIPWSDPETAEMVQIDGILESSLVVAQIKNYRANLKVIPFFLTKDTLELSKDLNHLRLNCVNLTGKVISVGLVQDLKRISLVHICNQPSVANYIDLWEKIYPKIISGGIAIFSGCRDIISMLQMKLKISHANLNFEIVFTVRIQNDGPDTLEAVLVLSSYKLEQEEHVIYFGDPGKKIFKGLSKAPSIISNLDHFNKVKNFDGLTDSSLVDVSDSNIQMKCECLAKVGYDKLTSAHDVNNFSHNFNNDFCRFCQPFGQYVYFENGRIEHNLPMDSSGHIPFQCLQHSTKYSKDLANWIWGASAVVLPTIKLKGLWFNMAASSAGFSHWMIESFLPLLVAQEFGLKCNLICTGPLDEYAKLYLQLIGISQVIIKDPNYSYICEFLVSPINMDVENIPMQMSTVHHPIAIKGINRLLNNAGIFGREQTKKLYVSRGDANSYRGIINDDMVSKLFHKRGYTEINSSRLQPLESLHIYSSSKIIAGPLGAGLINCIFSKPKTKIVSFQARAYYDPLLEQIAHLLGHNYSVLGCDHFDSRDFAEGGARNSNYFVNLEKLDAMLDLTEGY